jgi:protoheme IX farnesyltransferase
MRRGEDAPALPRPPPRAELQVTKQVVIYTWLTVAATLALVPAAGWLYALVAVLAGAWFLTLAYKLHAGVKRGEPVKPLKLFLHSNNYLSAVFVALAVDSVIPLPLLFG